VRLLFDQGTPVPLRSNLIGHTVSTAFELGWASLTNGELLSRAESNGFDALVTTDQNLRYQQNRSERRLAIAVLLTTSWPRIERHVATVCAQIDALQPGSYLEIVVP
jgi:hypothetical protein